MSIDARWVAVAVAAMLVMVESRDDADAFRRTWAPAAATKRYWNHVVANAVVTALLAAVAVPKETFALLEGGPIVLGVIVGVGWAYAGTRLTSVATELAKTETKLAPVAKAINTTVFRWDVSLDNAAKTAIDTALTIGTIEDAANLLRSAAAAAYPLELDAHMQPRPHPNRERVEAFVDEQVARNDQQGIAEYGRTLILQERIRRDEIT